MPRLSRRSPTSSGEPGSLDGEGTFHYPANRTLFSLLIELLFSLTDAFGTDVRAVTACLKITERTGRQRSPQIVAATANERENCAC
jgi:hypothetical protein